MVRFIITLCVTISFISLPANDYFKNMPPGWYVIKEQSFNGKTKTNVGRRLGVKLKALSNNYLNINGKTVMVNIIELYNQSDAIKVHNIISKMKGNPAFCLLNKNKVIEFTGTQLTVPIARKVAWELGFSLRPDVVKYQLSFKLGAVDKLSYMNLNKLSNLLAANNKALASEIGRIKSKFIFGKKLFLRCDPVNNHYTFEPVPHSLTSSDGITEYSFNKLPALYNIPFATVNAEVRVEHNSFTKAEKIDEKKYLMPTEFWPSNDSRIKQIARKLTAQCQTMEDRINILLKASKLSKHGPVSGSRWGVKKVLEQKYGNCWDASDLFITMCRAINIPCRQVAGWLYGISGHVWAEYWIKDTGWQQVDPSSGGYLKCGIYHIPYFTSADGHMPILYISFPKIELLNSQVKK